MPNIGDQEICANLAERIHQGIKRAYPNKPNEATLNRSIGTLKGLSALSRDPRLLKLGNLILQGNISYRMWKYPQEWQSEEKKREITTAATELGFKTNEEFLHWLQLHTPNPSGLAPLGYDKGGSRVTYDERRIPEGDKFDIHVAPTYFLIPTEYDDVIKKGASRRQGKSLSTGPLFGWEEYITLCSDSLLEAIAISEKYNEWRAFFDFDPGLPCGQGRFPGIIKFVKSMQEKHGLSDQDLLSLKDEVLSTSSSRKEEARTAPPSPSSRPSPLPSPPIEPLEQFTDMTKFRTGRVPNFEGLCLIADHLKKKHGVEVFVAEEGKDVFHALDLMTQAQIGTKIAVQGKTGEHWYALLIEKAQDGKLNVVLMDSLGDGATGIEGPTEIIGIFEEFRKNHPEYQDSKLYQNIDLVQFDRENCGLFSMKFCDLLLREPDFVGRIQREKYLVDRETRKELDESIARHPLREDEKKEIDSMYASNIESYVLPPEYFSFHQKEAYLQYYSLGESFDKDLLEERKKIIREKMGKNLKYTFTETVDGKCVTTVFSETLLKEAQRTDPNYSVNMRIVHFRNKYWEQAISGHLVESPETVQAIVESRKAKNLSRERLGQIRASTSPSIDTSPLQLRSTHAKLSSDEAKFQLCLRREISGVLTAQQRAHEKAEIARQQELGTYRPPGRKPSIIKSTAAPAPTAPVTVSELKKRFEQKSGSDQTIQTGGKPTKPK